jgi:hypothetical protein
MPNWHALRCNYYLHMLQDRLGCEDILSLSLPLTPTSNQALQFLLVGDVSQSASQSLAQVVRIPMGTVTRTRRVLLKHRANKNPADFNSHYRWRCGFAYSFLLRSSLTLTFQFQSEFDRENIINILCWTQTGNRCICYMYAAYVTGASMWQGN